MKHIVILFALAFALSCVSPVNADDGRWGSTYIDTITSTESSAMADTAAAGIARIAVSGTYVLKTAVRDSADAAIAANTTHLLNADFSDSSDAWQARTLGDIATKTASDYMLVLLDGDDLTNGQCVGYTDSIGVAGENLVLKDLVYQHVTGKWYKAQGDSAATVGAEGIVLETINIGNNGLILRYGYIKVDAWTTVGTPGAPVYVDDDTAGLATTTIPPDAGDFVFGVGTCWKTDLLFFNPPMKSQYIGR